MRSAGKLRLGSSESALPERNLPARFPEPRFRNGNLSNRSYSRHRCGYHRNPRLLGS